MAQIEGRHGWGEQKASKGREWEASSVAVQGTDRGNACRILALGALDLEAHGIERESVCVGGREVGSLLLCRL